MGGSLRAKVISADLEKIFTHCIRSEIQLSNACREDELTCTFTIEKKDYHKLNKWLQARGDTLEILGRNGFYWKIRAAVNRPAVLLMIAFLMFLSYWIPQRILFVHVEGNERIPAEVIRMCAEESGVQPGAVRKLLNSEKIKNSMLEKIPELKWVGINTRGCIAFVSVSENSIDQEDPYNGPGSIIARLDGIIDRVTVTEGTAQCEPGDAVTEGKILISGYSDCGSTILHSRANGNVIGQTMHTIAAITPALTIKKDKNGHSCWRASLILGKKRINLWKDSGIYKDSCDRMYKEYRLTLPGGFLTPICLSFEHIEYCNEQPFTQEMSGTLLTSFADDFITAQLDSGRILDRELAISLVDNLWRLEGEYLCREQLGVFRGEQIGEDYGQIN